MHSTLSVNLAEGNAFDIKVREGAAAGVAPYASLEVRLDGFNILLYVDLPDKDTVGSILITAGQALLDLGASAD